MDKVTALDPRGLLDLLASPRLPWPVSYVPAICRFLCTVIMAPVILLLFIDVGGYLLFKLFYRPFGTYPRYSYFKQATREPFERGTSDSPTASVSPLPASSVPIISRTPASSTSLAASSSESPTTSTLRHRGGHHLSSSPGATPRPGGRGDGDEEDEEQEEMKRAAQGMRKGSTFRARAESVGVEGPLLETDDLRSPSGSEYGDDSEPDSPKASFTAVEGVQPSFSGKKGFGMTPVR